MNVYFYQKNEILNSKEYRKSNFFENNSSKVKIIKKNKTYLKKSIIFNKINKKYE